MNDMNIELKGRKAIVTGSTAGIGRATAEGLAHAGASVVINGRGNARVDEAVRQMRLAFPEVDISGIAADLSTAEGTETFFAQAPDADILVNNLGTAVLRDFVDTTDEDWLSIFQINVMSGVRMTRHYLPRMVRQGWGRVVFVSSESGVNIPKEMIDYGMTKTAQLAVSRGLAESVTGTALPSTPSCQVLRDPRSCRTGWQDKPKTKESRRKKPSKCS
jgi:NAD(P)-dependent dehydrogenase (short-subunit alcohol dehydrogenase family)